MYVLTEATKIDGAAAHIGVVYVKPGKAALVTAELCLVRECQTVEEARLASAVRNNSAVSCHSCGKTFEVGFVLTLDEALRAGAIIRGMDIEEEEVKLSEEMAAPVRDRILRSGDEQLVRILRILPEESFARLKGILERP
jgi:hypothetical protein